MIKSNSKVAALLCVAVAWGENVHANISARRTYGYQPSNQCFLYDIGQQSSIKTLDQNYNKDYEIAAPPHNGRYSIKCDFSPNKFDYMMWYYDGTSKRENYHEWWMNGDNNGSPGVVPWLGEPGHKTIEVVGYKYGRIEWTDTFYLEAKTAQTASCTCNSDYDCLYSSSCPNTNKCLSGSCVNHNPPPPPPPSCGCFSDNDCIYSSHCPNKCNPYGQCVNPPPPPPPPPTHSSTCSCWNDNDCIFSRYCPNKCGAYGRCVGENPPAPTPVTFPVPAPVPRPFPVPVPVPAPRPVPVPAPVPVPFPVPAPVPVPIPGPPPVPTGPRIPSDREVRSLIRLLDQAVIRNKAIAPQWLRLAFHDAGTFDIRSPVGGANGCLLTHPPMREEDENLGLDLALETLQTAKEEWDVPGISSADVIQFAGHFTAVRQRGNPGLTGVKETEIVAAFEWGRPDERNCRTEWTENLPGFEFLGADASDIPGRCMFAGSEIKEKMMDRNGFTAFEATALIGAHTIGVTRNVFGIADDPSDPNDFIAPWASNGHDNATPQGPVFDNAYHSFLLNDVVANSVEEFAGDRAPLDRSFESGWFRDSVGDINQLDTDIALAFPSQNTGVHPHFNSFTETFANDNEFFIISFMEALTKMSKLGVTVPLSPATQILFTFGGENGSPVPEPVPGGPAFDSAIDTSITVAEEKLEQNAINRAEEIALLTTPI